MLPSLKTLSRSSLRGFSLAEVLIAIVIIAILTIGSLSVFSTQIQKARDTERRNDVFKIKGYLDTIIGEYGAPPGKDVKSRKLSKFEDCKLPKELLKCFKALKLSTNEDLDETFLDPSQGITNEQGGGDKTYGYLYVNKENSYRICAMLENQGSPDLNRAWGGRDKADSSKYNNLYCLENLALGGGDLEDVVELTPPEAK